MQGRGGNPVTSGSGSGSAAFRVLGVEVHSDSFTFDADTQLSSATLSVAPHTDTGLRGLCLLLQNGVGGWTLTPDTPTEPNTWRLRSGGVDLFGDVTGEDWSLFRIQYPAPSS